MNAEVSRIRRLRNYKEEFDHAPEKIKNERLGELIVELNSNMSILYDAKLNGTATIDNYIDRITANIYLILNMFNEMGVYPDYFYDEIVKMNTEYKKVVQNNNGIRGNYRLYNEINLSARVTQSIKNGLENGYYRVQAYQKKDINDAFLEMIGFFQAFNIPYNIHTEEQCKKVFNEIMFNHINITEKLMNSDFILEDIECLSRLLFEYMSFFASVGIYPKKYLDEFIDTIEEVKYNKK